MLLKVQPIHTATCSTDLKDIGYKVDIILKATAIYIASVLQVADHNIQMLQEKFQVLNEGLCLAGVTELVVNNYCSSRK